VERRIEHGRKGSNVILFLRPSLSPGLQAGAGLPRRPQADLSRPERGGGGLRWIWTLAWRRRSQAAWVLGAATSSSRRPRHVYSLSSPIHRSGPRAAAGRRFPVVVASDGSEPGHGGSFERGRPCCCGRMCEDEVDD
jgi:hypothetical protein